MAKSMDKRKKHKVSGSKTTTPANKTFPNWRKEGRPKDDQPSKEEFKDSIGSEEPENSEDR